jgi:hypothetical protein
MLRSPGHVKNIFNWKVGVSRGIFFHYGIKGKLKKRLPQFKNEKLLADATPESPSPKPKGPCPFASERPDGLAFGCVRVPYLYLVKELRNLASLCRKIYSGITDNISPNAFILKPTEKAGLEIGTKDTTLLYLLD